MSTNCCSIKGNKTPNQIIVGPSLLVVVNTRWDAMHNDFMSTSCSCSKATKPKIIIVLRLWRRSQTPKERHLSCKASEGRTDNRQERTPSGLAGLRQLDLQLVSCIVTSNGVVKHRHDRSRLSKRTASTSRSGGTSVAPEAALLLSARSCLTSMSALNTSVRARLKMFTDRSFINARGMKAILVVFEICSFLSRCRLVKLPSWDERVVGTFLTSANCRFFTAGTSPKKGVTRFGCPGEFEKNNPQDSNRLQVSDVTQWQHCHDDLQQSQRKRRIGKGRRRR